MTALHAGWLFLIAAATFALATYRLRWPLPITLLIIAVVIGFLGGFGFPFRHLLEGGFGYLNLVLALFAGAVFGQAMRESGAGDAVANTLTGLLGGRVWPIVLIAGGLPFLIGMFVGIAGVAVLATGVIVAPMLRGLGLPSHRIAAFIAVTSTCGMIAPPVNVPAMMIADGVNMPFLDFGLPLLVLSLPPALFAVYWFGRGLPATSAPALRPGTDRGRGRGITALGVILGFWIILRAVPELLPDPGAPLVLIVGAIIALTAVDRPGLRRIVDATFAGTPLVLAAVLVTVGVVVQIMTLTGIRGWLVVNAMALVPPWLFAGLAGIPLLGGGLTSMGAANILGVPFAFALIHQDMILNVSALSVIAALSEFCPPTAIAAALSGYVVGDERLWPIIKASAMPMLIMLVLALAVLLFAESLGRYLTP